MSKIDDLITQEGAAAENQEIPDEVPEHVRISRPNLGPGTVVSVRLSADERERLQQAAERASLPLSTLLRIWALDRLRTEEQGGDSVAERLARLEREVFHRSA